jgi:hypothetical protein
MALRALLLITIIVLWCNSAFAWDPWGDVTHPGQLFENVKRESRKATLQSIPEAVNKAAPVIATIACLGCTALLNVLPQDQKAVVETIVKSGMVVTTLGGSAGIMYLTLLDAPTGDVNKNDIPVQIHANPPDKKNFQVDFKTTACMVQLQSGMIEIYSKSKPAFWDTLSQGGGDILTANAAPCPDYNKLVGIKNITSVRLKITGASPDQLAPDDGSTYRYHMLGTPYSG